MNALDELKKARWSAVATVAAFLAGLVLATFARCQTPDPNYPLYRPAPALTQGPSPTETPDGATMPPAATATAGVKTRVVIERPIARPAASCVTAVPQNVTQEPGSGAHLPTPALAPGAAELLQAPLEVERIIIETEGTSAAVAPVPTPPPPVLVPVERGPGAFGVLVGTMPGVLALDYQFTRGSVFGYTVGASIVGNGRALGAGGGISLPGIDERLYFGAGVYQEYKLIPDPGLYCGAGYRF